MASSSSWGGWQSEGDRQLEVSQSLHHVSRAWMRWVTSVWKGYLWFLFTSGSSELWLHTHLTRPSSVTSLNISSALFYFLHLPFLPLKLTALWWALGFQSKLLRWEGYHLQIYIFTKCYSKLVMTTRTPVKGNPIIFFVLLNLQWIPFQADSSASKKQ